MEHNEENKDLAPGKIDTTTDTDNSQNESNVAIDVTEPTRLTLDEIRTRISPSFDTLRSSINKWKDALINKHGTYTDESEDSNLVGKTPEESEGE